MKEVREIDLEDTKIPEAAACNEWIGGDVVQGDDVAAENTTNGQEESNPQEPMLRRSTRIHKPNTRYLSSLNYLLLTDLSEPEDYNKVVSSNNIVKWEQALKEELRSLEKNMTWVLTQLPKGKRTLQNKTVYQVKEEVDDSKRYKTRLGVKGFLQKKGIDYTEVFSPVVKLTTI